MDTSRMSTRNIILTQGERMRVLLKAKLDEWADTKFCTPATRYAFTGTLHHVLLSSGPLSRTCSQPDAFRCGFRRDGMPHTCRYLCVIIQTPIRSFVERFSWRNQRNNQQINQLLIPNWTNWCVIGLIRSTRNIQHSEIPTTKTGELCLLCLELNWIHSKFSNVEQLVVVDLIESARNM